MATTPNLGLTIPVGGTTPGALNNTPSGTYPYIESANLNLIDSLAFSPNNPVPTSGININSSLSLNGYGLTNVGFIDISSLNVPTLEVNQIENLTTLSGIAIVTAPGSTGIALVVNSSNTLTAGGSVLELQNNGTVTNTFDYAGNLNLGQISNFGTLSPSIKFNASNGAPLLATITANSGSNGSFTYNVPTSGMHFFQINGVSALSVAAASITSTAGVALNLGAAGGIATNTPALNFNAGNGSAAFQSVISSSTGGILTINAPGQLQIQVAGTNYAQFTSSGLNLLQTPTVEVGTASSSLTLKGNQAATGGPGVILDNAIAATSGKSISFRSNGSELLSVGWNGHIIQGSGLTSPTVGTFNSGLGTVATFAVTGSDNAGIITFTTGTASLIGVGGALMVLTLSKTYSSTSFVAFATTASSSGVFQSTPLYCVPTAANQITIYNGTSFTPASSTAYSIQYHTMGAGATS